MSTIIAQGTINSMTVDGIPWLPSGPGATTQTVFESALRAAISAGQELNWMNGNVRITAPIVIEFTAWQNGGGLNMNGAKLICDFNDATKYALTFLIQSSTHSVGWQGGTIRNIFFDCSSPACGAIKYQCRTNQSWIYAFRHQNLNLNNFSGAGLFYEGSVFEFFCDDINGQNNLNLFRFRNAGPIEGAGADTDTDVGIVSAVYLRGGTWRDSHATALYTDATVTFREPRDFTVRDVYCVNNNGNGMTFSAGFTLIDGCGFENNVGSGIYFQNEGCTFRCRGASHGPMPYLISGYAVGELMCYSSRVEGEGSPPFAIKVGNITGTGLVNRCDEPLGLWDISGPSSAQVLGH